jgi:hypothetical protein
MCVTIVRAYGCVREEQEINILKDKTSRIVKKAVAFHNSRIAPAAFFSAGFVWDSVTLTRIDRLFDNLVLLVYLLLLGALIALSNFVRDERPLKPILRKYSDWYPLGMQFFLGGLFSAYVVYYFQSASLTKASLFLILLVVLLIANELLTNRLNNLYLQIGGYFLASFTFLIFFIPVVIKVMNYYTFLSGGIISLALIGGILFLFHKKSIFETKRQPAYLAVMLALVFVLFNVFYLKNWIPPVPLSLKSAGIYHHVSREDEKYALKYVKPRWYQFLKKYDNPFDYREGDVVYCFSAIFAPAKLKQNVYHHWQRYLPKKKKWLTTDKLSYEITGGRGKGYRGYTYKKHVVPGRWRVDVMTEDGLLLGKINFRIQTAKGDDVQMKTDYF